MYSHKTEGRQGLWVKLEGCLGQHRFQSSVMILLHTISFLSVKHFVCWPEGLCPFGNPAECSL